MKVKNNTETPQLRVNWKHASLVVLHVVVLVLSVVFGEIVITEEPPRALP